MEIKDISIFPVGQFVYVEIISDVEIPLEVDSGKMRFTLFRKN